MTDLVLPVDAHADTLRAALRDHRRLVLAAPPGTGKSTRVPRILLPETGHVLVLQPRRIAARNLALRVAAELGEAVGESVGYQVRFEQARGPCTRIVFQTTGVFWNAVLQNPTLPGVSLVVLDEFHERTLDADAALAWVRQLQRTSRPDLGLVVMSATLETDALRAYMADPPFLEIDARPHPIQIEYLPPHPHEPVWTSAARGLRHLFATGQVGSVLVFMPGTGEIRRAAETLGAVAEAYGYTVLELHGAQKPDEQQRALTWPATRPCVVIATNVAETSLTIPGVTAVIDTGLSRQAAYDAERDLDTLALAWIAQANMTQRAGRAGRLGPGRCVRLWTHKREASFAAALPPEIARLDLGRLALDAAALPGELQFLTPPPPERWAQAHATLARLGAVDTSGALTPVGRRLLRYPLPPAPARVLDAASEAGCVTLAAAMVAVAEAADQRDWQDEADLYMLGLDLVRGGVHHRRWAREVTETWKQLLRLARPTDADRRSAEATHAPDAPAETARRADVSRAWLTAWGHRLASRHDKAYTLADGRKAMLAGANQPQMLLAIQLHEVAGAGGRQATIPVYLPIDPAWTGEAAAATIVVQWDAARQRVVQERHWIANGLVTRKEALAPTLWDRNATEALVAAKLVAGEARLAAWDADVDQLLARLATARRVWPELNIAAFDAEDWALLYPELVIGKSSPADVAKSTILEVLRDYAGWEVMSRLDRLAPTHHKLPGGKPGKLTYFADEAPPELSARLGDMIGLEGTLSLFDGRVPVLFDILAPNYRTVQKTFDMTGFWANTYPEVKKELKRRYPKHPWP